MRGDFRKLISVALSVSVVLSMTGCAFLDKSKDEVLDAAEAGNTAENRTGEKAGAGADHRARRACAYEARSGSVSPAGSTESVRPSV